MARKKSSVSLRLYKKKMNNLSQEEAERLKIVEQLARKLMNRYEVSHFKFRFGYGRTYAGNCTTTTIILSLDIVLNWSLKEIENVILHEIAHAIVPVGSGHRLIWQLKAKELGVNWSRNYQK